MNRVTLYWDSNECRAIWYKDELGVWRYYNAIKGWINSAGQEWSHEDFCKSLTVNNFKEK